MADNAHQLRLHDVRGGEGEAAVKRLRGERAVLVSILLLALLLRAAALPSGLPDVNRYFFDTDEMGFLDVAMSMGGGDLNPRYYQHPSLLPYLLLVAFGAFFFVGRLAGVFRSPADFAAFYWANKAPFHLIGRSLVVVFGVASVYLVYLIGRRAYGSRVGLLGALFLALAPLHVGYSQIIKTDVPSLFFGLLAVLFSLTLLTDHLRRGALLSGAAIGLAAGTRYPSALFVIAPLGALALRGLGTPTDRLRLVGTTLLLGVGALVTFFVTTPYAALDFLAFRNGVTAVDRMVRSPEWLMFYRYGSPNWWVTHLVDLASPHGITGSLFVLGAVGLIWALWRRRPEDFVITLPIVAFYVFYSLPRWTYSPVQFLLPIVPLVALLSARMLSDVTSPGRSPAVLAVALVLTVALPLSESAGQVRCGLQKRTTRQAREWIEASVLPGTAILINSSHAPQLSFTLGSLQRWEKARQPVSSVVAYSRSRREQGMTRLGAVDLLALRRGTLTAPPAYDLHILPEGAAHPEWDYYRLGFRESVRRFGIQYVVTSTYDMERFMNERFDPRLVHDYSYGHRLRFFKDVEMTGILVREFPAACASDVGVRIYRFGP